MSGAEAVEGEAEKGAESQMKMRHALSVLWMRFSS
jgi:hypothetical protein